MVEASAQAMFAVATKKSHPTLLVWKLAKRIGISTKWLLRLKLMRAIFETRYVSCRLWDPLPVYIHPDHKNLLFLFALLNLRPTPPRHVLSKAYWWALHLSRFDFKMERLGEKRNVRADVLTRWTKEYRTMESRYCRIAALSLDIISSRQTTDSRAWDHIQLEQCSHALLQHAELTEDGIGRRRGWMRILEEATKLKIKVLVICTVLAGWLHSMCSHRK